MKAGSVRKWIEIIEAYDGPWINGTFRSLDDEYDPLGLWINFVSPGSWKRCEHAGCYLHEGSFAIPSKEVRSKSKLKSPEWEDGAWTLHGPSVVRSYFDLVDSLPPGAATRPVVEFLNKWGHLL